MYLMSEMGLSKFDKMHTFEVYNPHNNVEFVLARYLLKGDNNFRLDNYMRLEHKKKRQSMLSHYTLKCYVARRLKIVRKMVEHLRLNNN